MGPSLAQDSVYNENSDNNYGYSSAQQVVWGSSPRDSAHVPQNAEHLREQNFLAPVNFNTALVLMDTDYIAIAQAALAVSVLCAVAARPLLPHRPLWLAVFAQEDDRRKVCLWSYWTVFLGILATAGFVLCMVSVVLPPFRPLGMIDITPWLAVVIITAARRPTKTPMALLFLYIATAACDLTSIELERRSLQPISWFKIPSACICGAAVLAILSMPMRDPGLVRDGIGEKTPTHKLRSPEDSLTLWKFMTVSWMGPLISRGATKQLNDEDVWQLPYEFQHGRLHMLFRDLQGSMIKRLLQANGLDLIIISVLGLVEAGANLSAPLLLKKLLESIKDNSRKDIATSMLWAAAILVIRLLASQSSVFSLWYSRRCYERSRGEMITTLYAKTLARKSFGQSPGSAVEEHGESTNGSTEQTGASKGLLARTLSFLRLRRRQEGGYDKIKEQQKEQEEQPATTGKILNIMKSDVYEVAQRFWDFPQFVTIPLRFILSFFLVWTLVGWACLLGLACVALTQLLNVLVIRRKISVERVRRSASDHRLEATSQFVQGIRHLRWYDWQSKWLARVLDTRQTELNLRLVSAFWGLALSTLSIASGVLFPVATFFAYTFLAGHPLSVEVAFPALQLFVMMESSFKQIPDLVTVLLNASVAMGRIESFMKEPDKEDGDSDPKTAKIEFDAANFAWPGRDMPVLRDIDLEVPRGLTVVFGKVGSGKSALLQAILGELDHCGGGFTIPNDMVGYCAQRPWLQHMTIRDNILFSAPYDPERYSRVLDACALLPDLANFEHGDLSDMGENGIGLSGGQRARVALARAVYSQARILLLDDPIAALDHQTAESIVRKLFQGSLFQGRTIILVTHRVDICLHLADQMVEIEDGLVRVLDSEEASREAAKFLREEDREALREGLSEDMDLNEQKQQQQQQQAEAVPSKFIQEEHRASGGVMLSVYWTYIKAGTLSLWAALLIVLGLYRLATLLNYWFLKAWGEAYEPTLESSADTVPDSGPDSFLSHLFDSLPDPDFRLSPWLLAYLGLALVQTVIFSTSTCLILFMVYKSSKSLFTRVVKKVSGATFRFYDVTPVGRLMNRLLSDMGMIDGGIMAPLQGVAWAGMAWISSMAVIATVTPIFLVFSVGMTLVFGYIFMWFLPTSQSLRRLEMTSLSPLMSNFGILLDGLATIRAFKAQPHFQQQNISVTDAFQKMDHFYWSLQAWLQYRFDALSAVSTFALTLLALYEGLSPGLTAFVLTTASQFVQSTHALCKLFGQLQMDFVSAERVIELLDVEQEPEGDEEPPASWPSDQDDVVFDNVTIKYAEHLDPSLSNVSFRIPGGSTCAVLGRTGSGKSTLALALLATMHPVKGGGESSGSGSDSDSNDSIGTSSTNSTTTTASSTGTICVGAQDLSKVDVHAWRRRISFVAQDPVLFPGSLRENLDPLNQFTDGECAEVLRRVLGEGWSLDSHVEGGGGGNLSQGQRQLVGIGRAVLRRSPVVVLDEATASVDSETAGQLQKVLREELASSTVVTIAHRLEAVKGADWVVRLEGGRVVEAGPAGDLGQR